MPGPRRYENSENDRPRRRPIPPAGSGPSLNTSRPHRRTSNTNNNSSTTPQQLPQPPPNRSTATRPRHRAPSESNLPATSGALLRARRRSEIQNQLMRNVTRDSDET